MGSYLAQSFLADLGEIFTSVRGELRELSLSIWNKPELAYEEHFAHQLLTDYLVQQGFEVTRSHHLPTAFKAVSQSTDFDPDRDTTICFMSEYDALPSIGHACGHNLIAITGVAAAVALRRIFRKQKPGNVLIPSETTYKPLRGRVICLGTPAEETTGGKIDLLEAGALQGIDFCLMLHPAGNNVASPAILGLLECEVGFAVRSGASNRTKMVVSPNPGKFLFELDEEDTKDESAVTDAAVALYTNLSLFRQQLQPGNQIHGVIYRAGWEQGANGTSRKSLSSSHYYLRSPTVLRIKSLKEAFHNAVIAAASSTGCEYECKYAAIPFEGLISNSLMAKTYQHYAEQLGMDFPDLPPSYGSTDMGNVSNVIPSIHPMYSVTAKLEAPATPLLIHTKVFQQAAGTNEAHENTLKAALAMAMTGLELLLNKEMAAKAKTEFEAARALCRG